MDLIGLFLRQRKRAAKCDGAAWQCWSAKIWRRGETWLGGGGWRCWRPRVVPQLVSGRRKIAGGKSSLAATCYNAWPESAEGHAFARHYLAVGENSRSPVPTGDGLSVKNLWAPRVPWGIYIARTPPPSSLTSSLCLLVSFPSFNRSFPLIFFSLDFADTLTGLDQV